jgi:8-oxo-dGTP diphosphatase
MGSQLVEAGLTACHHTPYGIVVVLGHPHYFPRFVFTPAKPLGIVWEHDVPDEAFMVQALREGALTQTKGVVKYRPEFATVYPVCQHSMVASAKGSSIMAEVQYVFGEQGDGHTYHARRAVYAVIRDSEGRVATVQAHGHLWLPGGGIEEGETPEQALVREVAEECAQRLHIAKHIGEALQYFYAASDDKHFAMHAVFYAGAFLEQMPGQVALPFVWVFPDAKAQFFHASHVWAAHSLRQ